MELNSNFEHMRSTTIESLNIDVQHYRHKETGAEHYHLASDNPENVFLVALRTVPMDSKGVAHILEHTALCGSEKYPVRDPFFMMIRRSLNTFMNAFTSGDWTAYPFASQNRKDFFNLLDVYLDAVFFSRLDKLDFAQEGHRLEFVDDKASQLEYKGVVYNEMKGAMSSPVNTLWQTLAKYLYPTSTYHYNSGGDPEDIPKLTYDELLQFYKTHYHPSNAVFMTYGNIPVVELQNRFETNVLCKFKKLNTAISVDDEKRYLAPVRAEEYYALEGESDLSNKTHVVLAWLLADAAILKERLRAELLTSVLMENSASPLRKALETTSLGTAPSPLCGLDDSYKEMSFVCGLEGSNQDQQSAIEDLILGVLRDVVENGVAQEDLEAALHQLELDQREIGGDGYPFGLQLILNGLNAAVHCKDPIALLNLDAAIAELRDDIKNPDFVQTMVKEMLLDNQHRVRLTMMPDSGLNMRREQASKQKLEKIAAELSDNEKQNIIDLSKRLSERQKQKDDESVLPKVGIEDIPREINIAKGEPVDFNSFPVTYYAQGTNGLVYQQLIMKLPDLSDNDIDLLPLLSSLMSELGVGEFDYLKTQSWQSRISGGLGAFSSIRSQVNKLDALQGYFVVSSKALQRNHAEMSQLIRQTLESVRYDELQRIRELINQRRARRELGVISNGHTYAMSAAASTISPIANMGFRQQGLMSIKFLQNLDDALKDDAKMAEFVQQLSDLHERILQQSRQLLLIGEQEYRNQYISDLDSLWQSTVNQENTAAAFSYGFEAGRQSKQIWLANTQVHFCAKAYPTVAIGHPDSAALSVLGGFLRNGHLHTAIREQGGAYGGGASQDSGGGAFRFYSYRDPRLVETLNDFDRSLDWLMSDTHEYSQVEQAILGVVSGLDKPGSPSGEAKDAFYNELHGRTPEQRKIHRENVLKVTLADLQRVAQTYLQPDRANVAVITNAAGREMITDEKFEVFEL